ncbi:MAG: nuclease-related domain-containing protein [Ferruginibacter sp.]
MWVVISLISVVVFILIIKEIRDKKLLKKVTKQNRGTRTERDLVLRFLKYGIPAQTIFHDLYIKNFNGNFSQIDLVVATKVGIIVLEVKDYSGWIFGSAHNSQWMQILAYGKRKYRLYNPIMQNSKHISDLKKQLRQFETIPFYSIVVFYGNCELKDINFVPKGTFIVKSNRALEVFETLIKITSPLIILIK